MLKEILLVGKKPSLTVIGTYSFVHIDRDGGGVNLGKYKTYVLDHYSNVTYSFFL